jgi:hypothetical protein
MTSKDDGEPSNQAASIHILGPSDARRYKRRRDEVIQPIKKKNISDLPHEQTHIYLVRGAGPSSLKEAAITRRFELLSNWSSPPQHNITLCTPTGRRQAGQRATNYMRNPHDPIRRSKPRGFRNSSSNEEKIRALEAKEIQPPPIPQGDTALAFHTPPRTPDHRPPFRFGMPGFSFTTPRSLSRHFESMTVRSANEVRIHYRMIWEQR